MQMYPVSRQGMRSPFLQAVVESASGALCQCTTILEEPVGWRFVLATFLGTLIGPFRFDHPFHRSVKTKPT